MTKEKWKAVKGFEGLYEVSNMGRVKSLEKTITNGINITHYNKTGEVLLNKPMTYKEKILKPCMDACGYLHYRLSKEHGRYTLFKAHRLVAKHFLKDYSEKLTVNHINGNKMDNRIKNLEMMTRSDNIKDYLKNRKKKDLKCNETRRGIP